MAVRVPGAGWVALALLLLLLAACTSTQPYVETRRAAQLELEGTRALFLDTATAYDGALTQGKITAVDYQPWRVFVFTEYRPTMTRLIQDLTMWRR